MLFHPKLMTYDTSKKKTEPIFEKNFLGNNQIKFIEILLKISVRCYQHFY